MRETYSLPLYSIQYYIVLDKEIDSFALASFIKSKHNILAPFLHIPNYHNEYYNNDEVHSFDYCNTKFLQISFKKYNMESKLEESEKIKEIRDKLLEDMNRRNMFEMYMAVKKNYYILSENSLLDEDMDTPSDFVDELRNFLNLRLYVQDKEIDEEINKLNVFCLSETEQKIKESVEDFVASQTEVSIVYNGWINVERLEDYDKFENISEEDLNNKKDVMRNKMDKINKIAINLSKLEKMTKIKKLQDAMKILEKEIEELEEENI